MKLDHLIVKVNDLDASVAFYTSIVGLVREGMDGPFMVLRVDPELTVQLAPFGTQGNEHYAFALSPPEFAAVFARLRAAGVPYGDSFHAVGNMLGPGEETGARGVGKALYFFDPNRHLLEIRHYDV